MPNGAPRSQFHNTDLAIAVSTPSALSTVCAIHRAVKTAQEDYPQFNSITIWSSFFSWHTTKLLSVRSSVPTMS